MPVSIKISKILEVSYSYAGSRVTSFDQDKLMIKLGLEFGHNLAEEIFSVYLSVGYDYTEDSGSTPYELISFKVAFHFSLGEMASVFSEKDAGFNLPEDVLYAMVGTAIGTTRGMLLSKLAGTELSSYYIPIVSPREILQKN